MRLDGSDGGGDDAGDGAAVGAKANESSHKLRVTFCHARCLYPKAETALGVSFVFGQLGGGMLAAKRQGKMRLQRSEAKSPPSPKN
jgi:hypothetical protein